VVRDPPQQRAGGQRDREPHRVVAAPLGVRVQARGQRHHQQRHHGQPGHIDEADGGRCLCRGQLQRAGTGPYGVAQRVDQRANEVGTTHAGFVSGGSVF
jgi:hypothetical protein